MEYQEKKKPVNRIIREKLIVENSDAYPFCEIDGIPLELMHAIPESQGKMDDRLISLCPNCNSPTWTQQRAVEFNTFLVKLMNESRYFSDVQAEAVFGEESQFKADITANIKTKNGSQRILIECTNTASFSSAHLEQTINQIKKYKEISEIDRAVLALPGRITEKVKEAITKAGIEVWDFDFIATNFADELKKVSHPYFQPLLSSDLTVFPSSQEERFINELRVCEPGKETWNIYKKLMSQILEYLLHPPLESPIAESADFSRNNGRDFIIPNYAPEGFWKYMRDRYFADYIVVDIKNHKGRVKKRDALQFANYLKSHGAGLFGIIVSRNGQDTNCLQTLKEQWVAYSKLIIVLSDENIEEMLMAHSSGGSAEATIGRLIQDFRISL